MKHIVKSILENNLIDAEKYVFESLNEKRRIALSEMKKLIAAELSEASKEKTENDEDEDDDEETSVNTSPAATEVSGAVTKTKIKEEMKSRLETLTHDRSDVS